MKRILAVLISMLLLAGCTNGTTPAPSQSAESSAASSQSSEETRQQDLRDSLLYTILRPYMGRGRMQMDWEGDFQNPDGIWAARDMKILEVEQKDDQLVVTVELYGSVFVDPETMTDSTQYTKDSMLEIPCRGCYDNEFLPIGKSVVTLRADAEQSSCSYHPNYATQYIVQACRYQPYDQPGIQYLKEQTQLVQEQVSASQKVDIAAYDEKLLEYIWHERMVTRYIESPAELTLWDLEQIEELMLYPWSLFPDGKVPQDFALDAELLRLMPNLREVSLGATLKNYSVFENHQRLENLHLYNLDNAEGIQAKADLSTLAVGKTKALWLHDPVGVVDMSRANAEELHIESWRTAVDGFAGCDKVKRFYMMGTRTDTAIVNAESFPNAEYLNLYFYSEGQRYRNLSQLATFGEDVMLDVCLGNQACNDKTVESLAGVRLSELVLDPKNGPYPLEGQPKQEFVDAVKADKVTWGDCPDFRERTGNM